MTDLFSNSTSDDNLHQRSPMNTIEYESPNFSLINDKSMEKTPSSKLKSHFRFTMRDRVLTGKMRRQMMLETDDALKRKLPRFITYDGDLSLAPSSMNKSVASENVEQGTSEELPSGIDIEKQSEKVDSQKINFSGIETMKLKGNHTFGPSILTPLHTFDVIDLTPADRWKMESETMNKNHTIQNIARPLDAYVHRIGDTRFISDEENPKGTFLYRHSQAHPETRENQHVRHAYNSNDDDADDVSSIGKFFDWYVRMERSARRKKYTAMILTVVLFVIMICMIAMFADGEQKDEYNGIGSSSNPYTLYSNRTYPSKPFLSVSSYFDETKIPIRSSSGETWNKNSLKAMMEAFSHSNLLEDPNSAQGKAFQWILDRGHLEYMDAFRVQQRYILATFYYSLHDKHGWTNRHGWLSSEHECTWFGIQCGLDSSDSESSIEGESRLLQDTNSFKYESIIHINLTYNNLHGTFPKEIQHLSLLQRLILSKNFLLGSIPEQVLPKLKSLRKSEVRYNLVAFFKYTFICLTIHFGYYSRNLILG
jgi:hypothetical protein